MPTTGAARPIPRLLFPVVLLLGVAGPGSPQGLDYVRAHYTKHEHQIPMRDGVKLFTAVYVPKDASAGRTYPILLTRTPYSVAPYGADNYKASVGPSELFARDGFIFVYQDVRGRFMSEGGFVNVRPVLAAGEAKAIDETTDTHDTIEWLLTHLSHHNGKVGMWGISYPGFYTSAGMIRSHPALKAASPQAPITDWFIGDDFRHNGALYLPHAFNFLSAFGLPRPAPTARPAPRFDYGTLDGYDFYLRRMGPIGSADRKFLNGQVAFWNELVAHDTYDAFWQARNLRPHLKNITAAVLTVGGWFDAEDLFGALETYKWVERQNPGIWNALVMGPWFHGGWARSDGGALGDVAFGSSTSQFYREQIELPFFRQFLKEADDPSLPEAFVFETGTNRWRRFDAWPPPATARRTLYLAPGGRLSWEAPPEAAGAAAYDEYVSDPAHPVPYVNSIAIGMTREHMTDDQRFASRRADVLTYGTDVLAEDVTVAGPLAPLLHVATSGTDADFVVKLIDVYPDVYPLGDSQEVPANPLSEPTYTRMGGYQQLVRGEVFRGKFRKSFEKPEPFAPNQPDVIDYVMPDVLHTFKRGHRIMIQIQSTWFPLVDRNPQKFMPIQQATEPDFQKATHRVYRSKARPTQLRLSVLGAR